MNKKEITLGIAIASFCAATMTSCGEVSNKYGAPEIYHEYNEELNQEFNNKKLYSNQDSNNTNQENSGNNIDLHE